MVDIPLTFPNVGNALVSGAHAGYYAGKARQEQNAFDAENAARPDLPAAVSGDAAAIGRVAQTAPSLLGKIAPMLQRLDQHQAGKLKAASDFSAHASNAILQADPKDRPALYQQMLELGRTQGHDVSKLPPEYSPALEPQLRLHRAMSKEMNDLLQKQEEERGRNSRHNPVGGLPYDAPSWSTPAPAAAGPRADAGPSPMAPPVNVAQAAPVAATAPPPQMAQGSAPMAPQPSGEPQIVQGDNPGRTPQPVTGNQVVTPPGTGAAPAGVPAGFQAMGRRKPDGTMAPSIVNGKPLYHNAQTDEYWQPEAGPSAAPAAAPQTRAPVPTSPNAVVHTMPPGYEMVRQKGIPVVKDGYVPIISQNGPPLLLKPSDEKPQQVPQGYRLGPAGPDGQPTHEFIPGGLADPTVIERNAGVKRAANEKAIPQTVTKGMQENVNALKQIDRVDALLDKVGGSVGGPGSVAASILPGAGWLQNRIDTEGVNLRALVADIGSMKIHDRSGAAVTASEFPRLRPFIPTIADDAKTIREKLANFRAEYSAMLSDTASYYGADNGFKPYTPATDYLEGRNKGEPGKASSPASGERPPLDSFQR